MPICMHTVLRARQYTMLRGSTVFFPDICHSVLVGNGCPVHSRYRSNVSWATHSNKRKLNESTFPDSLVRTKWTLGVRERSATFVRETNPLQGLAKAVAQMLAPAQRYLVGRHRAIYEALEARKAKMRQNRGRRALQLIKVQYVGEVRKTLKKPKVTVQVHWAMASTPTRHGRP